jgi:CDGSH-type Zn-finger protein
MGTCGCGYSTDANKNCNGTHRVVQAVKADLAKQLAANGFAEAAVFVKAERTEK